MNHPNLISQICLNCTAGFVVLECANFVEETGTCKGCEVAHCCRQCGSHDTRPKTSEEIKAMQELLASGMYVPVERALYRCGDCGLEFTQRQCASHTGDGTTCMYDCECKGADKDDVHRCPMCFTLNGHYAGPISK
jgi:ribosomal protein L40E